MPPEKSNKFTLCMVRNTLWGNFQKEALCSSKTAMDLKMRRATLRFRPGSFPSLTPSSVFTLISLGWVEPWSDETGHCQGGRAVDEAWSRVRFEPLLSRFPSSMEDGWPETALGKGSKGWQAADQHIDAVSQAAFLTLRVLTVQCRW